MCFSHHFLLFIVYTNVMSACECCLKHGNVIFKKNAGQKGCNQLQLTLFNNSNFHSFVKKEVVSGLGVLRRWLREAIGVGRSVVGRVHRTTTVVVVFMSFSSRIIWHMTQGPQKQMALQSSHTLPWMELNTWVTCSHIFLKTVFKSGWMSNVW